MTDAERLKELFKGVRNRAKFAKEFKVPGGSSMIWQHLSGTRPISLEAAQAYMRGFNCSLEDISPELAKKYSGISFVDAKAVPDANQDASIKKSQSVFEILDVRASCGSGSINSDYPEVISRLIMPTEKALELIGVTNHDGRVKVINASNDSMSPTIKPKDLLFVDTSVIEYRGEGIYLLVNIDELLCKRLQRVGSIINVKSDNPAYDSWEWKPDDRVMVVGRVLCAMPIEFKVFYRGNE